MEKSTDISSSKASPSLGSEIVFRTEQNEGEECRVGGNSVRKPRDSFLRETSVAFVSLKTVGSRWGRDVVQHY